MNLKLKCPYGNLSQFCQSFLKEGNYRYIHATFTSMKINQTIVHCLRWAKLEVPFTRVPDLGFFNFYGCKTYFSAYAFLTYLTQ